MNDYLPTRNEKTPVSREQLYEEVWAEPMTKVALKYKVSSSFLARICTRLKVPRPQRGYWAMYATGKRPKKPPLPAASPGDELEWARDGEARREPLKLQSHPLKFKRRNRTIAKQVEEAEHKAEIQRIQYEQQCEIERQLREEERCRQALEEAERRRVKAIKDSRDELSDIIKAWAKAKRIEEFFAEVEYRTADLEDAEKVAVLGRLALARKMVDSTDALEWLTSWKTPEERNA